MKKDGELTGGVKTENTKHKNRGVQEKVVKAATFCIMMVALAAFCICTKWLPAIGDHNSAPNIHVSNYYIEHSVKDTGAKNIVSGTLADYRGFDTMLETAVMFVSGLVVTLLLVHEKKGGRRK